MNTDTNTPFQYLPLARVGLGGNNLRKRFPEDQINELADNIKQHGVLQPILVRPIAGKTPTYEIVAGDIVVKPEKPSQPQKWEIVRAERIRVHGIELARRTEIFMALHNHLQQRETLAIHVATLKMAIIHINSNISEEATEVLATAYGLPVADTEEEFVGQFLDKLCTIPDLTRLLCEFCVVEGVVPGYNWSGAGDEEDDEDLVRLLAMSEEAGVEQEGAAKTDLPKHPRKGKKAQETTTA